MSSNGPLFLCVFIGAGGCGAATAEPSDPVEGIDPTSSVDADSTSSQNSPDGMVAAQTAVIRDASPSSTEEPFRDASEAPDGGASPSSEVVADSSAGSVTEPDVPVIPPREMDCTPSSCPCVDVWPGDFNVQGPEDLQALACVTEISGSLHLSQTCGIPDLDLPKLERIGGDLSFHQTGLTSVTLPALTTVGGFVYFHQNVVLEHVELSELATTGAHVYFHGNCSLLDVDLSSLAFVGPTHAQNRNAYFYFNGNASLESLDVPRLQSVGDTLYVALNCALADLSLQSLEYIGGDEVYVRNNGALGSATIAALDARLTTFDFAGDREMAAGGSCNAGEACGESTCNAP